ncbi:PstS family phosphate ABC transporter substrate-binding protein [Actinokineospora sp. HUAS TT18]|uniref:PstS family phosphate ABC transporter substrate-binding protein n=1 Tax=Actinokineospora sp. HUAS TT18 TaxID=3447451 RepID=UPI003F527804
MLKNLEATVGLAGLVIMLFSYLVAWWRRRKRVSYRVHLDTPVTPDHGNDIPLELNYQGEVLTDPSFALVRIMNTGSREIRRGDFALPLTLEFAGRKVVDAKVIEGDPELLQIVKQNTEWPPLGDTSLALPLVPLNRKNRIKVLVLLTGTPKPGVPSTTCGGFIVGGRILRDTTRGDGPSRRAMYFGGLALALVGAFVALLVTSPFGSADAECATGEVRVVGSSAFAPAVEEIKESYEKKCDGAEVTVVGDGSLRGLTELDSGGEKQADRLMAMSDGPASLNQFNLTPHPVGVVAFAVVVNKKAGVTQLSTEDVKDIFAGRKTNWRQFPGGADQEIRIISRDSKSGTRVIFETKVLGGGAEPAVSSNDCVRRDRVPDSPVVRCELDSTTDLLDRVDQLDGAVGYADVNTAMKRGNSTLVKLDNLEPSVDSVVRHKYPFWAMEYFYTYGVPKDGGLVSSLIRYMGSGEAKVILRRAGFAPCEEGAKDQAGAFCGG